ncbi:metalloregulator ArsR/SmtB family transcription factor [Hoeflea sp. CAU 1731]
MKQLRQIKEAATSDTDGKLGDIGPLIERSHEVARLLKLLSNQKRLLILCRLAASGECAVHELAEYVDLSQSALSQHLAKLRKEGLVTFRRESQVLYYSIGDANLRYLLTTLKEIHCPDPDLKKEKEK